jgi:hypothetical protein
MTRIRVQKPKKIRKRSASKGPLEDLAPSGQTRSRLINSIEELLEDIDRVLDETGGWPG